MSYSFFTAGGDLFHWSRNVPFTYLLHNCFRKCLRVHMLLFTLKQCRFSRLGLWCLTSLSIIEIGLNHTPVASPWLYHINALSKTDLYCFKGPSWSWSYDSLSPVHVEVYSIQHYVIKFVSVLRIPPPIKLTTTI
jgi:hypothetical protein